VKSHDIVNERCFHHKRREAVAVCPECRRVFCRECITEHEDRIICATCLKRKFFATDRKRLRFISLLRAGNGIAGIFILWIFFYFIGQILVSIPSSFHEGTVWKSALEIAREKETPETAE
jgi:hypothetical protein